MTQIKYLGTADPLKPVNPDRVDIVAEQCCVKIREVDRLVKQDWRVKRYSQLRPNWDPERCQRQVAFEIDGHRYCRIHAGTEALRILLAGAKISSESP